MSASFFGINILTRIWSQKSLTTIRLKMVKYVTIVHTLKLYLGYIFNMDKNPYHPLCKEIIIKKKKSNILANHFNENVINFNEKYYLFT